VVANLRRLVELNETLKDQEKLFRVDCKRQYEYWQKLVSDAQKKMSAPHNLFSHGHSRSSAFPIVLSSSLRHPPSLLFSPHSQRPE
jgi:hypothetical protein